MRHVVDQLGAVPVGLAVRLAAVTHLYGPAGMYAEDAKHWAAEAKKRADSTQAGLAAVRSEAISTRECRIAANVACDQARTAMMQARIWAVVAFLEALLMTAEIAVDKLHLF